MKQRSLGIILLATSLLVGCSADFYRRSADKEVDRVFSQNKGRVANMDPKFGIKTQGPASLGGLPANTKVDEFMGEDGEAERGAPVLSLDKALEIAVNHSPAYQDKKEELYLSALQLTLARHQFTPIFSAGGTIENNGVRTDLAADPGNSKGSLVSDSLVEKLHSHGSAGADWLIQDLGKISVSALTDFTRFVAGGAHLGQSSLGATLTRPLLRNAGYKTEMEELTQADFDFLYAMRDFTRYRKSFSIGIAADYYSILNQRDQVRNAYVSLKNSRGNIERGRALAKEGRMSQSDLGRLEQSGLSRESSWVSSVRYYKTALDNFKISLGIQVHTRLILDNGELERLKIEEPELALEDAIRVAQAARLDLQTLEDRCKDAEREAKVAAEQLKPQIDLQGGATLASGERARALPALNTSNYNWNGGAVVDLGLDRKAQRNDYRRALIRLEKARRTLKLERDRVELDVRESFRSLEKSKRDYEIYQRGVELAQRRVEEQELRADLGLSRAQDQVDAQNDLVDYKNRLTDALISHTNNRLRFWNNIGILYIKENGRWYTHKDAPKEEKHG